MTNSIRVFKFGGTSVGSIDNIQRVIEIARNEYDQGQKNLYIICSAFGGVTDKLINAGKMAQRKDEGYMALIEEIKARHYNAIEALLNDDQKNAAKVHIQEAIEFIKNLLRGIYLLNQLPDHTMALLSSYGERLSNYIIADAFQAKGLPGVYVNASSLIKTNSQSLSAKVNFDATNKNIQEFDKSFKGIGLVTGFIASDSDGQITTLGRGGSDFTASIFGSALNVAEIQIWTDVDGVLTADPRKVDQAFSVPELSYKEAMELSHFGAKVIYPPTFQPAMDAGIPLLIKNTFRPEHPGTKITSEPGNSGSPVKGISSIHDIALMRLEGSGLVGVIGTASRLFTSLSNAGINIIFLTQGSSEHSICFGVDPQYADLAKDMVETEFKLEIQAKYINPLVVERKKTVIAVIGQNMQNTPGVAARLFKALGKNGINVAAIAQGSSELNITAVIDQYNEAKALNALHEIFFEKDYNTINLFVVGPNGLIGNTLMQQIYKQIGFLRESKSIDINLAGLINSRKMLIKSAGIDLENWSSVFENSEEKSDLTAFTQKIIDLNFANSVVVDCSASEVVVEYYERLLAKSISVVTPNKIANTLSQEKYDLLRSLARKTSALFLYETNVGAGLPVINTLRALQNSGDNILKIEAVLSGSLSFIFNSFNGDVKFSEVVNQAKQKGFTEPDPRDDLSGLDVARKSLILSREMGVQMELSDIEVENLVPEDCREIKSVEEFMNQLATHDSAYDDLKNKSESEGKVLRYMATIENGQVSIGLKSINASHPFYNLSGSDNMIVFTTERYKANPLVVKGPGAGAEVTAAGVFAEIISIGNYMAN